MFVTDPAQVTTGFRWSHQRLTHSAQMRALYRGNWDGFIPDADIPPGLKREDIKQFNWFAAVTDFYKQTIGGESLTTTENIRQLPDLIEDMVTWKSITGYAVAVKRMDGSCGAISPSSWCPIYNPADYGDVRGAVLGYPYYAGELRPDESAIPNRIDIVTIINANEAANTQAVSSRMTYALDGQSLGPPVSAPQQADAVAVAHWGDGLSDYPPIENAVRQYCIRMAGISRILNRHSNPLLTGPQSVLVAIPGATPNSPPSYRLPDVSGGIYLPRSDEQEPRFEYVTWDGRLEAANQHIDRLLAFIQDKTGAPMSMSDNGSPLFAESGSARQVGLYAATSRIRRERRGIEQVLQSLYNDIRVDWMLEPFEDRAARQQTIRENFQAGIINQEEARSAIGW